MDMIVVMKASATADDVQRVADRIAELGLTAHTSKGSSTPHGDGYAQRPQRIDQQPRVVGEQDSR